MSSDTEAGSDCMSKASQQHMQHTSEVEDSIMQVKFPLSYPLFCFIPPGIHAAHVSHTLCAHMAGPRGTLRSPKTCMLRARFCMSRRGAGLGSQTRRTAHAMHLRI